MEESNDNREFYTQLVQRYADNLLSEEELEVFFHALKAGLLSPYLVAAMTEAAAIPATDAATETLARETAEIALPAAEPATPIRRLAQVFRLVPARIAVAAVIIGALAGGAWLWLNRPVHPTNRAGETALQPIRPGGNRATLTLASGQQIILDSASNGLLAQQGKVNVLKSAQGQLNYQAGKSPSAEIVYNTMTTPRGGTFKLTLADGTKVWLNAASSLRYPVSFAGSKLREVTLTGEGYFEIASNQSVPFTVTTGGTVVKVLGTSFDVMAYSNEKQLQTTLLDGAVAISENDQTSILKPGQQARITPEGSLSVAKVDADDYIAWKDGLIQLHHADIPTVMRQISRWYDVQVVYQGNHFPDWTLAGKVSRTLNLSQVLKVLQYNGINCKLEGRTLTVILN